MGNYKICPYCGSHLDTGEICDCIAARYAALSPVNRDRLNRFAVELLAEERASAAH